MNFNDYVINHVERGACTCGKCFDAPKNPEQKQPLGHTVNLTFFKVSLRNGANLGEFKKLVEENHPHWLDGKEHNYLECGGDVGDQGIAITAIGLGHLLGLWQALTPDTVMPFLDDAVKKQMAGRGMISLKASPKQRD